MRERSNDQMLLTIMTNENVHIYEETEELITRSEICWKQDFQTASEREKQLRSCFIINISKTKPSSLQNVRGILRFWPNASSRKAKRLSSKSSIESSEPNEMIITINTYRWWYEKRKELSEGIRDKTQWRKLSFFFFITRHYLLIC